MTPIELELFTKLQPQLLERKGEWKVGDSAFNKETKSFYIYRERLDNVHYFLTESANEHEYLTNELDQFIWLPRFVDLDQPERGLWGMLDWNKWRVRTATAEKGSLMIYLKDDQYYLYDGNPTEAVLRALAEQYEVKV